MTGKWSSWWVCAAVLSLTHSAVHLVICAFAALGQSCQPVNPPALSGLQVNADIFSFFFCLRFYTSSCLKSYECIV